MSEPLVSILIPCYNAERWITETLESALAQTWKNIEIIIVDDGSTDSSRDIAKRFESPRLKLISQENGGPGVARNRALRHAQGDFVQYLDHDDLLSPGKIGEQVRILHENSEQILAICGAVYFADGDDPASSPVERGWPAVDSDDPLSWMINLLGEHGINGTVPTHAWLTPRKLIETVGPWDSVTSPDDDGEYFCRVVLTSKGIRTSKQGFVLHRKFRDASNLGSAKTEALHWAALRSLDLKRKHVLAVTDDASAKRALARCYMHRAFLAYPLYARVTKAALQSARELGGTEWNPFPTRRGRVISRLIGWKLTRRASFAYHRFVKTSKRMRVGSGF